MDETYKNGQQANCKLLDMYYCIVCGEWTVSKEHCIYENIDKPSVFWCEFRVKNASLYLQTAFWHFLLFFIKKIVFLSFSFFPDIVDEVSNLRNTYDLVVCGVYYVQFEYSRICAISVLIVMYEKPYGITRKIRLYALSLRCEEYP